MPPRQERAPRPAPNMTDAESVQEGSRWINGRPTGQELTKWFTDNVRLHEGLDPAKYVTGVVLITGKEKHRVAKKAANGSIVSFEEERLVHTPYAKVETRIAYFWDLMAAHADEWVGVIEPGPIRGGGVEGLPPGFFRMAVNKPDGKVVNFVCCTMRVRILRAGTAKEIEVNSGSPRMGIQKQSHVEGVPVSVFPAATKMISSVNRYGDEDPFALMKAETGAIGRALGMAGMLVIPGSGVATAEDMQEAQAHEPAAGVDPELAAQALSGEPAAPQEAAGDQRAEIVAMIARLESENPGAMEEIREWAKSRRLNLNEISDTGLRAVHRKLVEALEGGA